jgi:TM2 domain-containing membrane protein YozV
MTRKILIGAIIIIMTAPFLFHELRAQYDESILNNFKGTSIRISLFQNIADSIPQPIADSVWKEGIEKMTRTESSFHRLKDSNEIASSRIKRDSQFTEFRMKKNPLTAVLLSAVLPGAGQFYNRSFWKIPVISGLVGYFGYEYFRNNNIYKDYRDQYNASITPENQFGDLNLKTLREFYRDQRNDFVWYFIIVYAANLIDAYVDAHLFDFDVSDNNYTPGGMPDRIYRLKMNVYF